MARRPLAARFALIVASLAAALTPLASAQPMSRPDYGDKGPNPKTPLPTDPSLTIGTLDNGLRYVIKHHENPPGKVGIWLHVGTGSLNETDDQRGLAHYLEHMAFNGSENFPQGELVKFFESIGLTFGRDQNAFTSFNQTAFQLYLPDTERATLAKGLLFFSDVAGHLLLTTKDIDEERGVILEELRTGRGPQQRLRDQWFERLAPGSRVGVRLPIGTEESINAIDRDRFLAYYGKWYVPSNMTVLVVGDLDPEMAREEIAKAFASLPTVPDPQDIDPGVEPYAQRRAIVAHDPEVTDAEVSVIVVDRPDEPTVDLGGLRTELIRSLAVEAFNRRLAGKIDQGEARMLRGRASVQNLFDAMRDGEVSATAEPAKWADALTDLTTEVRRAELHGFSTQELETARESLLSRFEQRAEQEPTMPARRILSQLNNRVEAGEPFTSASQMLDQARLLIRYVRDGEVNRSFAALFDTSRATFLLTLPTSAGVPEEAQVLAIAGEAADRSPEPDEEQTLAASLMEEAPTPGEIVELNGHPDSDVWTAVLSNGITVHHRRMTQRANFVDVRISLLGGTIEEDASDRGITMAAMQAWNRPATSTLTSAQVRQLMAGKKIRQRAMAQDDFVQLSLTGSPDDLETGFQLAHRLLTDPRLETVPFEQWRTMMVQSLRAARQDPVGTLQLAIPEAIFPADAARARPPTTDEVERLNISAAQMWLDRLIAEAPIEVAIVGDVDRETAFDLARSYLGSLPERPRMKPDLLTEVGRIPVPESDRVASVEVDTQTPKAGVAAGFFASDASNLRDTRLLQLASRTLSSRLIEKVREEDRLVYSINASVQPAEAFPGYGLFLAASTADPANADKLADEIAGVFDGFAKEGPTDEELETARAQVTKSLTEAFEEPSFWALQLSQLDKQGRNLDDLVSALQTYLSFTADDVRENFAKYHAGPKVRVIVRPIPKTDS
ncbi:MAG: insulinase family protein [Phycisphaeraceae bacterium]|nr:MAG: insulinase family protein [Phycisphaeraceae bacterium]